MTAVPSGLQWGLEAEFPGQVFGVDEVGRGPLAGPVVAAAVCLSPATLPAGLNDSKRLSEQRRNTIAAALQHVAIAEASVAEIDALNILQASHLAMARAIEMLARRIGPPVMVLVDGRFLPTMDFPGRAIIAGDSKIASIAAASIAAKVARDQEMLRLDAECPGYDWARNKGYPTRTHRQALAELGISPHHRRSFAPVRQQLEKSGF